MRANKLKLGGAVFDTFNYVLLTLFMLICIYPFYYILIYSVSDPRLAAKGITIIPRGFTFFNYQKVFELKGILSAFSISLLRTVTGTALTVFCCSLFAYIVTQDTLPMRKLIYRYLVITMYFNAGLIPFYLTFKALGLRNNFLVYIIPGAISAYSVILVKTFIEQLPTTLQESAMIDGASYFTIFIRIIFPLSKPIIATIAVFTSVGHWNNWFDNYIYCPKPSLQTLQLLLYNYLMEAQRAANVASNATTDQLQQVSKVMKLTPQAIRMSITMLVTLPILLVYPFMQRYFVKGIMMGAIKG